MNALLLTLFISLILVLLGAVFFVFCFAHRDHEHADRLSLLPLLEDEGERTQTERPAPPVAPCAADPPGPTPAGRLPLIN